MTTELTPAKKPSIPRAVLDRFRWRMLKPALLMDVLMITVAAFVTGGTGTAAIPLTTVVWWITFHLNADAGVWLIDRPALLEGVIVWGVVMTLLVAAGALVVFLFALVGEWVNRNFDGRQG